MSSDPLSVLLIEDNPGDARLFEEMLRETAELPRRTDAGNSGDALSFAHEQRLDDGLDALAAGDADVVLLDLNLPDSTGLDTLATVVDETGMLPVIVLTGLDDREVGIQAIERGAQDYLVKDNVTSDLLVRSIHHALERNRQDREQARRREQLEALNRLNRIAQDVTHAVITTSTQEELERAVCDRLVDSDAYRFAWIGDVSGAVGDVTPRASAGLEEGYLDGVSITASDDAEKGPTGRAVQTGAVQVMQNIRTDPAYEPWREDALERGYQSSAAIPILYGDVLYGVLNVYASSPNAFSDPEAEILARLGNVIGHAIAAIERKEALVSDAVTELEFRVDDFAEELTAVTAQHGCTVEIDNLIQNDEAVLAYAHVDGLSRERFSEAVDRSAVLDDARILGGDAEEFEVELVTDAAMALFDALATHGGNVDSATVVDGEFRFVTEVPGGRDTRPLIDIVTDHCPGASLLAQRTGQHRDDTTARSLAFEDRLTDKQRTALETAYLAGHFEWPRETNGEEIADRLGISPPTFHQHLRAAEKEVFGLMFEDE
ncbi:GAF domain-containing protein [Halobacteria archaeon HArc-gm2]|nr:GAF domain-containing protein [Halobacteria archaeon HArc-gm2]